MRMRFIWGGLGCEVWGGFWIVIFEEIRIVEVIWEKVMRSLGYCCDNYWDVYNLILLVVRSMEYECICFIYRFKFG